MTAGTLSEPNAAYIPIAGISLEDGTALATRLRAGEAINATLVINMINEVRNSANLIATSKVGSLMDHPPLSSL